MTAHCQTIWWGKPRHASKTNGKSMSEWVGWYMAVVWRVVENVIVIAVEY